MPAHPAHPAHPEATNRAPSLVPDSCVGDSWTLHPLQCSRHSPVDCHPTYLRCFLPSPPPTTRSALHCFVVDGTDPEPADLFLLPSMPDRTLGIAKIPSTNFHRPQGNLCRLRPRRLHFRRPRSRSPPTPSRLASYSGCHPARAAAPVASNDPVDCGQSPMVGPMGVCIERASAA
jgi:hypothetical protein